MDTTLRTLGEAMATPLHDLLRRIGATAVALVPMGLWQLAPIHAMTLAGPDRRCLISQMDVAFAPSARALGLARDRAASRARTNPRLLAVWSHGDQGQLSWAPEEAKTIAGHFVRSTILGGEEATIEAVTRQCAGATHLHFACHAGFQIRRPASSGLVLWAGQRLTLGEIRGMKEQTRDVRLVVLSACETAMGWEPGFPLEPQGLNAGFLECGVPAVIGALWAVNDRDAAYVMDELYRSLLELDPAAALAAAQRRAHDEGIPPATWAAFVCLGGLSQ